MARRRQWSFFADTQVPTYMQDGSLVLGTMLLAASSIGLGSCWINRAKESFQSEEGKALMRKWGLGDEYEGIGICILGYVKGRNSRPEGKKRRLYRHGLTSSKHQNRRRTMSYEQTAFCGAVGRGEEIFWVNPAKSPMKR